MISVLFVCLGNICRSPMAEFLFRDMVEKAGLEKEVFCASAGTSDEEYGSPVYPPVRALLRERGINCAGKRAVTIEKGDYGKYDLLLGMESRHVTAMKRFFGGDPDKKIARLLDLSDRPRDIADPWYTDNFDAAERDITEGLRALLETVKAMLKEA